MDGWDILLGLILTAYALPFILAAVFFVSCMGFAIAAARKQRFVLAVALIVLAFTPALVPVAIDQGKQAHAERRADRLAGLERVRIQGAPPRALVAKGGLGWPYAFRLLALGAFDEVHQIGRRGDHVVWRLNSTAVCNAMAARTRSAYEQGALNKAELPQDMEECLRTSPGSRDGEPEQAVVLLVGHESALKPSNSLKVGSVFELRIKTPSQDALLDYWEAPDAAATTESPFKKKKPYVPRAELDIVAFILNATRPQS